jgi:alpha-galactosidase
MRAALSFALALLAAIASPAVAATVAATPPMGWATWYGLRCDFDDRTLRVMADKMVANGMAAAGYTYLNVDDCWAATRDANGDLRPDRRRFPDGMAGVARYVHARGLKFGIYSSAGDTTCQRELQADGERLAVGSRGHEYQDARAFAAMGADFVKLDWCGHGATQDARASYELMRDAIAASGRPMLLSICEWGLSRPWDWGRGVGAMWRIAMDTGNCWTCTTDWGQLGVVQTFDRLAAHAAAGGPGGWNDPDVLMIGNGVLTPDEERAQISIYAIAAAPLIAAADLRAITPRSLAILTNREVIAVDQDALGKPRTRVRQEDGEEVWTRELTGGRRAVVLFNRTAATRRIAVRWTELDLTPGTRIGTGREIWTGDRIAEGIGFARSVPAHGVAMVVFEAPTAGRAVRPPT